jgi:hypothetical protein
MANTPQDRQCTQNDFFWAGLVPAINKEEQARDLHLEAFATGVGDVATGGVFKSIWGNVFPGELCQLYNDPYYSAGNGVGVLALLGLAAKADSPEGENEDEDAVSNLSFRADTSHIFRDAPGHLAEDTAENRAIIQSAIDRGNLTSTTQVAGGGSVDTYKLELPDGTQAWAKVLNDKVITNGGLNGTPRQ